MVWLISDAILAVLFAPARWIVGLLPHSASISSVDFSSWLVSANVFVDMPSLMALVSLFLAYEAVVIGVRVVLWVWGVMRP